MAGSEFYFAYGSNMNQKRMQGRNIQTVAITGGWINSFGLRFNKRSRRDANLGCANIVYAPLETIQGLLYQLQSDTEIQKLDGPEGTPYRYSRELFQVQTKKTTQWAWVYVANPGVLDNQLKPADWYIEHLLEGRDFLPEDYGQSIASTACVEHATEQWN